MSVIHLSSLFNTFLFWQSAFENTMRWACQLEYMQLDFWSNYWWFHSQQKSRFSTEIFSFAYNTFPRLRERILRMMERTIDDFKGLAKRSQHFNATSYNIVAGCRDMYWTGWPNARNIFNIFNIFNTTRGCKCTPGPCCATSGPNAHALVQQCYKNEDSII